MSKNPREDAPSTSRTYARPWAHPGGQPGMSLYYEVAEVGVLVVRAESHYDDGEGTLQPVTVSLRSLRILERLDQTGTPMPPPSPPDVSDDGA